MRRYTLVLHSYLTNYYYIIEFKRVRCPPSRLPDYSKRYGVHFIIPGWPPIAYPDGQVTEWA